MYTIYNIFYGIYRRIENQCRHWLIWGNTSGYLVLTVNFGPTDRRSSGVDWFGSAVGCRSVIKSAAVASTVSWIRVPPSVDRARTRLPTTELAWLGRRAAPARIRNGPLGRDAVASVSPPAIHRPATRDAPAAAASSTTRAARRPWLRRGEFILLLLLLLLRLSFF